MQRHKETVGLWDVWQMIDCNLLRLRWRMYIKDCQIRNSKYISDKAILEYDVEKLIEDGA